MSRGGEEARHRGFVHVPDEDTTEMRIPTPEQLEAIEVLEFATPGCSLVRLSLAQWAHVNRAVGVLARRDAIPAGAIPEPRTPTGEQ